MELFLIFVLTGLIFIQNLIEKKYEKDFEEIKDILLDIEDSLNELGLIVREHGSVGDET